MGMQVDNLVRFECDRCLKQQTFATMPSLGRPVDWHRFSDEFTEIDPDGNAMRNHTKRLILCDECAPQIIPQRMPDAEAVLLATDYATKVEDDYADISFTNLIMDIKTLAGAVLSVDPATGDD